MPRHPLERDAALLLGIAGPELQSRASYFRRIAEMLRSKGKERAAQLMETQAERAEEVIVNLADILEKS